MEYSKDNFIYFLARKGPEVQRAKGTKEIRSTEPEIQRNKGLRPEEFENG